ncbi:MAG TPA: hypothetical protein VNC22_23155 [Sporichthya sp.]|jgi:hypothetical protein|nr:hypothetical protein [Sporichthya sp.]
MPLGAKFALATSQIKSLTGNDLSIANCTVGYLAYTTVDPDVARAVITTDISTGLLVDMSCYMDWSAQDFGWGHAGGSDSDVINVNAINKWWLVFWSKATGSTTPRLHIFDGTTWTHTNGDAAITSDFTNAITGIELGDNTAFTPIGNQMELLWAGIWGETTSDNQAVSYADYNVLAQKANRQFWTDRSIIFGGTMADASGVGNNETARTSITLGTIPGPDWFTNFAPGPEISYVKEVGFVTNTTAGTTSAITVAAGGVPAGDTIVIMGSCDNTGTSGAATTISVADNSTQPGTANTYTLQTPQAIADPGAASAGQQGFFVVCTVTRALAAADTITITYGDSTAAKAINAQQFHNVNLTTPVLASSYNRQDNQTGQSVSVATGVAATKYGQVVLAIVAVEGGTADTFTLDTDTTAGVWTSFTRRGSGTTTSGATLNSAYKIVNAAGSQTFDGATMLGTARDHAAAILILDVAVTPVHYGRETFRPGRIVPFVGKMRR